MAASVPYPLSKSSMDGIRQYTRAIYASLTSSWDIRSQLLEIDKEYMRESNRGKEHLRAKLANKKGDKSRFQDVTVPIIQPQVESALAYLSNVFLTGYPIFDIVSDPANEDAALQMRTVIENNSVDGGWVRELMLFFRDGLKYNLQAIQCSWDQQINQIPETSLTKTTVDVKNIIWEGNCLTRRDLYNSLWDTRVTPAEIHSKGEFAGYTELMSRVRFKQFVSELPLIQTENIKLALESGPSIADQYFIPCINTDALLQQNLMNQFDWMSWATNSTAKQIRYNNCYQITHLFARVIPSDFSLRVPKANTVQIWRFIVVNDQVVIYAERQTNVHNFLPIIFGQPMEDGLSYQTKSFAQNLLPVQDMASALWNGKIASARRAISDRVLYDPSKVRKEDINSDNPAAKIPCTANSYGQPLQNAVYAFPYREDGVAQFIPEATAITNFGYTIAGTNPSQQGQFVKGNKTLAEYNDVMENSNARLHTMAMFIEAQVFVPLKLIIKTNILQYQPPINLFSSMAKQEVTVDPVTLRKTSLAFKVADGLTPTQKLISGETLNIAFQTIAAVPALQAGYNLPAMFSYIMQTAGLTDLKQFEKTPEEIKADEQKQEQQMAQQAQAEAVAKGKAPAQQGAPGQGAPAPQPVLQ